MVRHTFPFPLKPGDSRDGAMVILHRGDWFTDLDEFWQRIRFNLPQRDRHGREMNMAAWLTYFFVDGWTRRPAKATVPEPPLAADAAPMREEGIVFVFRYVAVPHPIQKAFDQEVKRRKATRAAVCLDYIRWSIRQHLAVWHEPAHWVGAGLTADARAAFERATPKQRRAAAEKALHCRDLAVFKHLLRIEPALTTHLTTWLLTLAREPTPPAEPLGLLVTAAPITPWLDRLTAAQLLAVGQALQGQPTVRQRVLRQAVTTPAAQGLQALLRAMGPRKTSAPKAPRPKQTLARRAHPTARANRA